MLIFLLPDSLPNVTCRNKSGLTRHTNCKQHIYLTERGLWLWPLNQTRKKVFALPIRRITFYKQPGPSTIKDAYFQTSDHLTSLRGYNAAVIPHSRTPALLLLLAKKNEQHYDVTYDGTMVNDKLQERRPAGSKLEIRKVHSHTISNVMSGLLSLSLRKGRIS